MPEEPEIRMITPEAVLLANESGRLFEIEMGRVEKFKVENPENPDAEEFEEKYVAYKFNQTKEALKDTV